MKLTRSDWIAAGQGRLIAGGPGAVKLASLTSDLGVSTGSFYHHFPSFREYLEALADYYGGGNVERIREALAGVADPGERLRLLLTLREEWNVAQLDAAMRVWARSDERARASVARLDDQLLEIFRGAFSDLGFDEPEARTRALIVFAAGVGQPFLFGRPTELADASAALELLTRRG